VPNKRAVLPEEDLVRLYLNDIGKHALLTKDDEGRLARVIDVGREARRELACTPDLSPSRQRELRRLIRGGDAATETFVKANLRLVVSIAKKYQAAELPLLDLVQDGNLGLMHAVEKFDADKGFKFSTYATWWIRQAITRGIANTDRTVRLPVHAGDLLKQVAGARGRLEGQLGRRPTVAELAANLAVSEERVTDILQHANEPLSLSESLGDDSGTELGDLVADRSAVSPFEAAALALLRDDVSRLLVGLDDREREILRLRFGLDRGQPRTLDEVGEVFKLTRERIRQIEARAMSKLRHPVLQRHAAELLTG
jgi:RNA polymerase sigma factor (sigma-70 family)